MENNRTIGDILEDIVGDTPVSVQLNMALAQMAEKGHTHDEYALQKELVALRKEVEKLIELVGDMPVSEQINLAINKHDSVKSV